MAISKEIVEKAVLEAMEKDMARQVSKVMSARRPKIKKMVEDAIDHELASADFKKAMSKSVFDALVDYLDDDTENVISYKVLKQISQRIKRVIDRAILGAFKRL
jgi:ribosomal protein S3AE